MFSQNNETLYHEYMFGSTDHASDYGKIISEILCKAIYEELEDKKRADEIIKLCEKLLTHKYLQMCPELREKLCNTLSETKNTDTCKKICEELCTLFYEVLSEEQRAKLRMAQNTKNPAKQITQLCTELSNCQRKKLSESICGMLKIKEQCHSQFETLFAEKNPRKHKRLCEKLCVTLCDEKNINRREDLYDRLHKKLCVKGKNELCDELDKAWRSQLRTERKKRRSALERAHDIRKFEIEHYWKRNLYFWGFQVAILAGVGLLLSQGIIATASTPKITLSLENAINPEQRFFALIFSSLGLIITIAWYFLAKGSKAWQENWEAHIDRLEYEFDGNLYRTIIGKHKSFYSVTRINKSVIRAFGGFWVLFCVYLYIDIFCATGKMFEMLCDYPIIVGIALFSIVLGWAVYFGICDKTDFSVEKPATMKETKCWLCRLFGWLCWWCRSEKSSIILRNKETG